MRTLAAQDGPAEERGQPAAVEPQALEDFKEAFKEWPLPDLRRRERFGPGGQGGQAHAFMVPIPLMTAFASAIYVYLVDRLFITSPSFLLRVGGRCLLATYSTLLLLMMTAYLQCASTDAGYIPPLWGLHESEEKNRRRFCKVCGVWKPPRCHHCSICNRCTLNMDHHMPWVNNCVGFYTKKYFFQLFAYAYASFLFVVVTLLPGCAAALSRKSDWMDVVVMNAVLLLVFATAFLSTLTGFIKFHMTILLHNRTTIENLEKEEGSLDSFDCGLRSNWQQVFGASSLLWWVPAHLASSRPVGNGLTFPERGKRPAMDAVRDPADMAAQVMFMGAAKTGKSHLKARLLHGTLPTEPSATIGLEFGTKEASKTTPPFTLQVWEAGGSDRYKPIALAMKHAWERLGCLLLVYDLTERGSFEDCAERLRTFLPLAPSDVAKILVGNKLDRAAKEERKVTEAEGQEFATANDMRFFEVSAVNGENLQELFDAIKEVARSQAARPREPVVPPPRGGLPWVLPCYLVIFLPFLWLLVTALWQRDIGEDGEDQLLEGCEDAFTPILHPKRLQPFYLLPVANGVKVMVTFIAFGYDLKFKAVSQPESCGGKTVQFLKAAGKSLSVFALILLCLNTYWVDVNQVLNADVNWKTRLLMVPVIMVTSPNYSACMAVWGSFAIQSPAAALRLKPKYSSIFSFGFPLLPCGAVWMSPTKYAYALLLLPYTTFRIVAEVLVALTVLAIGCVNGAFCFLMAQLKAIAFALVFQALLLLTLGKWVWAQEHLVSASQGLRPLTYCFLMNAWGLLCPYLICMAYGQLKRMTMLDVFEGIDRASSVGLLWPSPLNLLGPQAERLADLNRETYAADFDLSVHLSEAVLNEKEDAVKYLDPDRGDGFDDVRVAIVFSTLQQLVPLMLEQMVAIILGRALLGSSAADYYQAVQCTMTERQAARYLGTLEDKAVTSFGKASLYADLLWGLL